MLICRDLEKLVLGTAWLTKALANQKLGIIIDICLWYNSVTDQCMVLVSVTRQKCHL